MHRNMCEEWMYLCLTLYSGCAIIVIPLPFPLCSIVQQVVWSRCIKEAEIHEEAQKSCIKLQFGASSCRDMLLTQSLCVSIYGCMCTCLLSKHALEGVLSGFNTCFLVFWWFPLFLYAHYIRMYTWIIIDSHTNNAHLKRTHICMHSMSIMIHLYIQQKDTSSTAIMVASLDAIDEVLEDMKRALNNGNYDEIIIMMMVSADIKWFLCSLLLYEEFLYCVQRCSIGFVSFSHYSLPLQQQDIGD